jgi:hypothetical protein
VLPGNIGLEVWPKSSRFSEIRSKLLNRTD